MRRILIFAILASLAVALPARADVRTKTYHAGFAGDADGPCEGGEFYIPQVGPTGVGNPIPANVGSVCWGSLSGFTRVSVRITDATGWKVAFWAGFMKSNGDSLGGSWSCATGARTIPTGAARLVVYIGGPASGPLECPDDVGVGTTGTVTATLT